MRSEPTPGMTAQGLCLCLSILGGCCQRETSPEAVPCFQESSVECDSKEQCIEYEVSPDCPASASEFLLSFCLGELAAQLYFTVYPVA